MLLSGVLATARSVCIVHAELGEHRQRERRHRTKGRLACRCVAHTTSRVAEGGAGAAVRGVSCDRPAVRPVYNPVYRRSGAESPRLNLYTSSRKICVLRYNVNSRKVDRMEVLRYVQLYSCMGLSVVR